MKTIARMTTAIVLTGILSGCAGLYNAPVVPSAGFLFSDIKAPLSIEPKGTKLGSKTGEASSTSILGIYATGDASVAAAAKSGGITTVRHIDYKMKSVLGITSTFTVVVYGD